MLNFLMLTSEGERSVKLPTSWREVSADLFATLYGSHGAELISRLLGVSVESVQNLPADSRAVLENAIQFLHSDIPEQMPEEIANVKVGIESVGQLEKCSEFLNAFPIWDAAPYVYAIYSVKPYNEAEAFALAEQIKAQPIESIYAGTIFLANQIAEFYNKYLPLLSKEPDENEIAAGIDRFEKYGFFATLSAKCGGDPLKYDAMARVPADVFYMTLLLDQEKADYQEQLYKLKNPTGSAE